MEIPALPRPMGRGAGSGRGRPKGARDLRPRRAPEWGPADPPPRGPSMLDGPGLDALLRGLPPGLPESVRRDVSAMVRKYGKTAGGAGAAGAGMPQRLAGRMAAVILLQMAVEAELADADVEYGRHVVESRLAGAERDAVNEMIRQRPGLEGEILRSASTAWLEGAAGRKAGRGRKPPGRPRAAAAAAKRSAAQLARGDKLADGGRFDEALAAYDRAAAADPGSADAHVGRGDALLELGRVEDALAAYDRAIALDPGHALAHVGRSGALEDLGRDEEAMAGYDRAVELEPDNAWAHSLRGIALMSLGRIDEAFAAYDRAAELDPGG